MRDSNRSDRPDSVEITIEGNEDLAVRRWLGPSPLQITPNLGHLAGCSRENLHVLIVNDEDLTVRPWRRAPVIAATREAVSGQAERQDGRTVSGPWDSVSQHLRMTKIEGVTVVSFVDEKIFTAENSEEIGNELFRLVEKGHILLLLNFSDVQHLSNSAIGKLIELKKRISAVKGKLKLCCIDAHLRDVFLVSGIDQVFEIYENERSALEKS
jgi:anti-sigma B factor antagonist